MPNELSHLQRLKKHLSSRRETIISIWRERVLIDCKVESANHLSRSEFRDHIPVVLQVLEDRLDFPAEATNETSESFAFVERDVALSHGDHRWHQGYTIEEIIREWSHLNLVVQEEIEGFCSNDIEPHDHLTCVKARRIWAEIMGEGITQSAARFDELQKAEAKGNVRDLEALMRKTQMLEQQRGVILQQATHDLRGSLSVVRGASTLLNWHHVEKMEPHEQQHVIRILTNGVHSLWEMMNEMLELARLEAGVESLQLSNFDVGTSLKDLGIATQVLANEKQLEMIIEGPTPFWSQGDAVKTKRIAQNLLLNALKYTQNGYVRLCWKELPEDCWQLEIHDSGPGLPQTDRTFTSLNSSGQQKETNDTLHGHGEGVGLSIVKRLCGLCGATLNIETGHDGSCFRVIFPRSYK